MTHIITIDTGTTNTRVTLWQDNHVLAHEACEVGVREIAQDAIVVGDFVQRIGNGVLHELRSADHCEYFSIPTPKEFL